MAFVLFSLFSISLTTNASEIIWPNNAKLAVNLSYDDALNSQLDNAIPVLNKYNIHGSFFLTLSNSTVQTRLEEWRQIAKDGHELGNHTIFHPCRKNEEGRSWVPEHRNLDTTSNQAIWEEVRMANAILFSIDGKTKRTYTPPCGDIVTDNGNYVEALQDDFVAIKWQNKYGKIYDKVYMPHGVSGQQLIEYVKGQQAKGGAVTFIFHGIGGDHLSVSTEAHRQLVAYLASHKEQYWTDSYINIMSYVAEFNKK
ncbi:polysaccharide deacetylase family protein [Psychrosphaera sp. B3R10]|uniref:polysaccharide deacetylase family protein n=1 Tax=unclassified Psychrosphaera TaxID=2641570 RepID=UPI001C08BF94|nr:MULTISPECIES: polysaccharide deacetylase family protein [unclassified Psychrosphaera]MBU2883989.1 polysaccharide deacetylase family protein [Psychrosphaera sp. I2R16]MBU2988119.1 polysaccharide deacetylase family protein [Psychrosphaera sp. B3R10]MDO6721538.1 polysaccharide deacetylase family protein [Psychrosphaera sp. 1_MG-2023]